MSVPENPATPPDLESLTPTPRMRGLIVLFLRAGLGFTVLNDGLIRYLIQVRGMRMGSPMALPFGSAQAVPYELQKAIPYIEIIVGVALIFGFLTTVSACVVLVLNILDPMLQTLMIVVTQGVGGSPMAGWSGPLDTFPGTRLSLLLLGSIVLWLSPRRLNPFSIDQLMYQNVPIPADNAALLANPTPVPPQPPRPGDGTSAYWGPRIDAPPASRPVDE